MKTNIKVKRIGDTSFYDVEGKERVSHHTTKGKAMKRVLTLINESKPGDEFTVTVSTNGDSHD